MDWQISERYTRDVCLPDLIYDVEIKLTINAIERDKLNIILGKLYEIIKEEEKDYES